MAFNIVPQWLVETLALALASNVNTGRILAEQLARSEPAGSLMQTMMGQPVGTAIAPGDLAQLPPLVNNRTWADLADELRMGTSAPNTLREWMAWRSKVTGAQPA